MGTTTRMAILLVLALAVSAGRAADLPDTLRKIRPSIVVVGTVLLTRRPPASFRGTGFAVGKGRHVITNAHTIASNLNARRKESLSVISGRGDGRVRKARLVGMDKTHDLALLSVDGPALPAMRLGNSSKVR